MNAELKAQTERNNLPKLKFFMIYKIAVSVLYFIPSFLMSVIALGLGFILLFIGGIAGADKHEFVSMIVSIPALSIVPMILPILLFVLTMRLTVKYFKNKYNKKLDLIVCIFMIIVGILYFVLLIYMPIIPLAIFVAALMIPIIVNILIIIKEK